MTEDSKNSVLAAKLAAARALIEEVVPELDQSAHTCKECGLHVRHNYEAFQIATMLAGMSTKLRRFEALLRGLPAAAGVSEGHDKQS